MLNIGYHLPFPDTIYAGRVIYKGYKNAFIDLGYHFHTFSNADDLQSFLEDNKINIFITNSNFFAQKVIDHSIYKHYKIKNNLKVFVNVDFRNSPIGNRINEAQSLSKNKKYIRLIKEGIFGDYFFNSCEQGDERMEGFTQETGYKHYTIALAADAIYLQGIYDKVYDADISFIGTYLKEKRQHIQDRILPLKKKYNLKLYGKDRTWYDRIGGFVQRVGQYFNIPIIKSFRKAITQENEIYGSSKICINIHEDYQKKYGGECNDRTFRTLACGGFQITDDVACIRKYLKEGEEIVIAKDKEDRFAKIDYYMSHPEERKKIAEAGRRRVLQDHTYHNRVKQILAIYNGIHD